MMEDGKLGGVAPGDQPPQEHTGQAGAGGTGTGVRSLPWAPPEGLQLAPGTGAPTGTPSCWGQMARGPDSALSKSRRTPWLLGGHGEVQGPGKWLG